MSQKSFKPSLLPNSSLQHFFEASHLKNRAATKVQGSKTSKEVQSKPQNKEAIAHDKKYYRCGCTQTSCQHRRIPNYLEELRVKRKGQKLYTENSNIFGNLPIKHAAMFSSKLNTELATKKDSNANILPSQREDHLNSYRTPRANTEANGLKAQIVKRERKESVLQGKEKDRYLHSIAEMDESKVHKTLRSEIAVSVEGVRFRLCLQSKEETVEALRTIEKIVFRS